MGRQKRERSLTEVAGCARRMIRATGRRVADADPEDLAELLALREVLEEAIATAVAGQVSQSGFSWSAVARGLGISRQGAWKQYASKVAS